MQAYEHRVKFGEINVVAPLFRTCVFIIVIIIVIKLSFIACLNKKHLAQKRLTDEIDEFVWTRNIERHILTFTRACVGSRCRSRRVGVT